ncbi:MAG: hypothetical protein K6F73_08315 [Lachnospiraceae bacterium]|nr:hypothetical protein [Lachnospiraceae bacterium]
MSKRISILIICFILCGMIFAGCARASVDSVTVEAPEESTPAEEEASEEKEEKEEEVKAHEEAEDEEEPVKELPGAKIYREFYDIVSDADPKKWDAFALLDLDGDEIYELLATNIDGERLDPGMQPYMIVGHDGDRTFENDELSDGVAGAGGYRGTLLYLPGKGILHESMFFAPFGEPADNIYTMKNGKIELRDSGYFYTDRSVEFDENYDPLEHGEWSWNNRTVTEDEYKHLLDDATDGIEGEPLSEIGWMSRVKVLRELKGLTDGTDTAEPADEESSDTEEEWEPYCGILYWYKQLQESGKSWEEMEQYESRTALVQHGWPYSTDNSEVRYVYKDVNGDGYDELIITYYNDPVDIYSNEGDAVYAYGVPYRAIAEIYPDGTIMEGLTMGTKGWNETWYRYDDKTYKYVPVKEKMEGGKTPMTFTGGKLISDVVVPDGLDMLN